MSDDELKQVEDFVLRVVAGSQGPITPDSLFLKGQAEAKVHSQDAIRRAMWHLVSLGRLDFTPDWDVVHS